MVEPCVDRKKYIFYYLHNCSTSLINWQETAVLTENFRWTVKKIIPGTVWFGAIPVRCEPILVP